MGVMIGFGDRTQHDSDIFTKLFNLLVSKFPCCKHFPWTPWLQALFEVESLRVYITRLVVISEALSWALIIFMLFFRSIFTNYAGFKQKSEENVGHPPKLNQTKKKQTAPGFSHVETTFRSRLHTWSPSQQKDTDFHWGHDIPPRPDDQTSNSRLDLLKLAA